MAGELRGGEKNLSHLILRKDGEIVGICQIAIKKILGLKAGIANIHRGPLWRKSGNKPKLKDLYQMILTLKNEYAIKRGLLLRIWPNEFENSEKNIVSIFNEIGFRQNSSAPRYRTLRLDLSPPIEELRKNLIRNWRNHLNRAEKNGLNIIEGSSDDLYKVFLNLLTEMLDRKRFVPGVDYNKFRMIQNELPKSHKMKIVVCEFEGDPVCAAICSAIGDTGIYLFGATANKGLKLNGSNLLQWHIIKWLKEQGFRWYDLCGIDPKGNPGVYHFKCGIAGKTGKDEKLIGQFDFYENAISYFLNILINKIKLLRAKKNFLRDLII